jgi:hypothetical protein
VLVLGWNLGAIGFEMDWKRVKMKRVVIEKRLQGYLLRPQE